MRAEQRREEAHSPKPPRASLTDADISRIRRIIMRWGRKHYKDYPWRHTDEQWQALVAEVLLQRTRADNVVPVYESLIARYPDICALHRANEKTVAKLMYPLGLHWRIPLMVKLLRALADRDGQVPCDLDELVSLPGVSPYAASATLSLHCGHRFPIIDANVVRWICRLVGAEMDGETRRKRWLLALADRLTPSRNWRVFNYGILDFTMEICARRPDCDRCPIGAALCAHGALILNSGR